MQRLVRSMVDGKLPSAPVLADEPTKGLDELPTLDWTLLSRYRPIARRVASQAQIYLSRGCPFSCAFCMERAKRCTSWRAYEPDRALEELHRLDAFLDLSRWTLFVTDALFGLDKTWRRSLLEGARKASDSSEKDLVACASRPPRTRRPGAHGTCQRGSRVRARVWRSRTARPHSEGALRRLLLGPFPFGCGVGSRTGASLRGQRHRRSPRRHRANPTQLGSLPPNPLSEREPNHWLSVRRPPSDSTPAPGSTRNSTRGWLGPVCAHTAIPGGKTVIRTSFPNGSTPLPTWTTEKLNASASSYSRPCCERSRTVSASTTPKPPTSDDRSTSRSRCSHRVAGCARWGCGICGES